MSSNYGFEPTLDGLNNIDADNTTTSDIVCNTIIINTSGTAPTRPPADNSTNIATTAYVDAATTGSFVTISGTQTVTGEKTFSNALTKITGTLRVDDVSASIGTATSNLYTGQTSGVLNIGTASNRSGTINIGTGSTATNNINIGDNRSGAGIITMGSNNSSTNTVSIQSATIDIGTVSPSVTTNDVSIGNGQMGSTIILNSETTCIDDLIVNNIKSTAGSMTIATDPVAYTDDITISTANDLTLNAGFNAVINGYYGVFVASNGFVFTSNGTYGMTFNENYGSGGNGISYNGTNVSYNNTGLTKYAGSEISIDGGQLTVNAGPFVIKSGGTERVSINYALGQTSIKIKTDGDAIRFTGSDNTLIMEIGDTLAPLYKKGSITIPDTSTFNLIPVASLIQRVISTAPTGYVLCDGTSYSTTASSSNPYYELYLAIGYTFGGAGATFKVPNYQGAFLRGQGSQTIGGVTYTAPVIGTAQQDAVLTPLYCSNQGYYNEPAGTGRQVISRSIIGTDPVDTNTGILPRFDRIATENRPMNYSVYYFIKY